MGASDPIGTEPLMEFRILSRGRPQPRATKQDATRSPRHDPAPDLFLRAPDGRPHSLGEFRGQNIVLHLFDGNGPLADDEAKALDAHLGRFQDLNATVIGVGPAGLRAQNRFAKKNDLHFMLLSDRDRRLSGRLGHTCGHATIIIDQDGRVDKVFRADGRTATAARALRHLQAISREENWSGAGIPPDPR